MIWGNSLDILAESASSQGPSSHEAGRDERVSALELTGTLGQFIKAKLYLQHTRVNSTRITLSCISAAPFKGNNSRFISHLHHILVSDHAKLTMRLCQFTYPSSLYSSRCVCVLSLFIWHV
jgi:hypothetical protein